MQNFIFNRNTLYKMLFLSLIIFYFMGFEVWFFLILFLALITFLFRKKINPIPTEAFEREGTFFSPVTGEVMGLIEGEFKVIQLKQYFFSDMGLRLPIDSEVVKVNYNKHPFLFRFNKLKNEINSAIGTKLRFKTLTGEQFSIQLLKCGLGGYPKSWVKSGDMGKAGAQWGFIPLGGIINIIFDNDIDIRIKKGEVVKAGETVLANKL